MSHSFTCPGGVIGALFADSVREGTASPELVARVEAEQKEWDDAGLTIGQWATRLQDGRLVAENSPEHRAEQAEFLSRFTPLVGNTETDGNPEERPAPAIIHQMINNRTAPGYGSAWQYVNDMEKAFDQLYDRPAPGTELPI